MDKGLFLRVRHHRVLFHCNGRENSRIREEVEVIIALRGIYWAASNS